MSYKPPKLDGLYNYELRECPVVVSKNSPYSHKTGGARKFIKNALLKASDSGGGIVEGPLLIPMEVL